ncbi:MAG: hypothetical protein HY676_01730 [Chloroflexi bacterium]|nr:hypothetical protein [Chloroflexota bacterium]
MTPDILRQIASDASVISIALLAASFVLISVVWKGFKRPFYALAYEQRKVLGNFLLITLGPVVFLYTVATIVGTGWPDLLQPSGILAMFLLLIVMVISLVISAIIRLLRRQKRPTTPRIDGSLATSAFTLAVLGLSVMCNSLALFGVISVALSVDLPNYTKYDFDLSRWLLLDGVALFTSGIFGTAYSIIPKRKPDHAKEKGQP